jgi:hypothetical protein
MALESFTDEQIHALLAMPKRVTHPNARWHVQGKHTKMDYDVEGPEGARFLLYLRQHRFMPDDFSCGLRWTTPSGDTLTLVRYNGPSHDHLNHIEKESLGFVCHIHRATQRYIDAGRKPEGCAEDTSAYQTLTGTFHCLIRDCRISGIQTNEEQPSLPNLFR